jgi:hypothetical protein
VTGESVPPKITVDLLPWNLKMKSQKEIRTEGLFASLNDWFVLFDRFFVLDFSIKKLFFLFFFQLVSKHVQVSE